MDAEIELRKQNPADCWRCTRCCRRRGAVEDARPQLRRPPRQQRIAWHARANRRADTPQPLVSARLSPVGEGAAGAGLRPDRQDLFARICGYFDAAQFSILDARVRTTRAGYALDTFQVITPFFDQAYRDLIALVEHRLMAALTEEGPLPEPSRGRLSRPGPSRSRLGCDCASDEQAQRWVLSVSASDRSGLLYSIARVLARHQINLRWPDQHAGRGGSRTPSGRRRGAAAQPPARSSSRRSCSTRWAETLARHPRAGKGHPALRGHRHAARPRPVLCFCTFRQRRTNMANDTTHLSGLVGRS